VEEEDVAAAATLQQFKALGHPMRHRLLFALGQGEATISQLAATLGSNKGNIAHHLKVLTDAGLALPAGTRQVRGGTEQYYRRAHRVLQFHDAAITQMAFSAIAAEIAAAEPEPEPFLILRTLRLNPRHVERIAAALHDLADEKQDADDDPRYGLLLGLYQPGHR
jgi:DNA-binding transcriptional ArsR family regulator